MADSQKKSANIITGKIDNSVIYSNGVVSATNEYTTFYAPVTAGSEYSFSYTSSDVDGAYVYGFFTALPAMGSTTYNNSRTVKNYAQNPTITVTVPDTCTYIGIRIPNTALAQGKDVMLNDGSSVLPYEPHTSTGWLHSLRKLGTATENLTLPQIIYADGTNATVGLKGNEQHTGTPSPQNPVMPNGVGERTAQLLDFDTWANNVYIVRGTKVVSGNSITITSTAATCFTGWNTTEYPAAARIPVTEGETIHLTWDTDADDGSSVWIFPNASATGEVHTAASNKSLDYTVPSGVDYITFRLDVATANKTITYSNIMFNTGSTAKPYEPYGYKIGISSGDVTTDIDLGSTQTVRQIKKLVLTGDEYWVYQANNLRFVMTIDNIVVSGLRATPFFCTHYIPISDGRPIEDVPLNAAYLAALEPETATLNIKTDAYTTAADFKAYLAAQYANGTPVTVWYILATPETAAVNEPLMKIGTYADTLSNAVSIPTTEGANSITVDTTVQPSEFTATWTGWHDAEVKEKSENYLDENDFGLVEVAAETYRVGTDVGVLPSGKYTFNAVKSSSAVQIYRTTKNGSTYNYEAISELPYTFTADGVSNQIFRSAGNTGSSWAGLGYSDIMLNTGETAQTYEPYWK